MKKGELTEIDKKIAQIARPDTTAAYIAAELEISLPTVYRSVRKQGLTIKLHQPPLSNFQKKRIRELASPDVSAAEIAKKIHSFTKRVYGYMNYHNMPMKPSERLRKKPTEENEIFCWEDFNNCVF